MKVVMYNVRIRYLTSYLMAMVIFIFSQPLHVKIATRTFNLENLGQGHGVQHSQWFNFMANIELRKSYTFQDIRNSNPCP